jgi:hypothetical protein
MKNPAYNKPIVSITLDTTQSTPKMYKDNITRHTMTTTVDPINSSLVGHETF